MNSNLIASTCSIQGFSEEQETFLLPTLRRVSDEREIKFYVRNKDMWVRGFSSLPLASMVQERDVVRVSVGAEVKVFPNGTVTVFHKVDAADWLRGVYPIMKSNLRSSGYNVDGRGKRNSSVMFLLFYTVEHGVRLFLLWFRLSFFATIGLPSGVFSKAVGSMYMQDDVKIRRDEKFQLKLTRTATTCSLQITRVPLYTWHRTSTSPCFVLGGNNVLPRCVTGTSKSDTRVT